MFSPGTFSGGGSAGGVGGGGGGIDGHGSSYLECFPVVVEVRDNKIELESHLLDEGIVEKDPLDAVFHSCWPASRERETFITRCCLISVSPYVICKDNFSD